METVEPKKSATPINVLKKVEPQMDWILKKMAGMNPKDPLTPARKKELTECAMNYGGAFIALIITSITIYIASTDDKALTEGFFKYMVFIILPILVGAYLVLPIFKTRLNASTISVNVFIMMVLILSLYQFYRNKSPASVLFVKYAIYGVAFLSIIIGLAVLQKIWLRFNYNSRGWFAVTMQIIFFIPCLLLEFIEYIKYEIGIAPNTVYVLLAIEAIIIGLYVFIPKIIKPNNTNTSVLLNDPVFLNTGKIIGNQSVLLVDPITTSPFIDDANFRVNYSISFWAYLNPNGNNPGSVLRLGNASESGGKPQMLYANGKYIFYFTNDTSNPYELNLPSQKWNFFVITYNNNKVDLFVNGNLEKTLIVSPPYYSPGDNIEVGSDPSDNGVLGIDYTTKTSNVSGAICNVKYHKTPMSQYQIISEYNLLMSKNPPIN